MVDINTVDSNIEQLKKWVFDKTHSFEPNGQCSSTHLINANELKAFINTLPTTESTEVNMDSQVLKAIRDNCKIVMFPDDGSYPLEHTLAANKDMFSEIVQRLGAENKVKAESTNWISLYPNTRQDTNSDINGDFLLSAANEMKMLIDDVNADAPTSMQRDYQTAHELAVLGDKLNTLPTTESTEWIAVSERLPEYGEPVFIFMSGVVQHITYCLDGCPDGSCMDWFEPYHFNDDSDELKFFYDKAVSWMYVDALPTPPEAK